MRLDISAFIFFISAMVGHQVAQFRMCDFSLPHRKGQNNKAYKIFVSENASFILQSHARTNFYPTLDKVFRVKRLDNGL